MKQSQEQRRTWGFLAILAFNAMLVTACGQAESPADPQAESPSGEWVSLFDGETLNGWTPKFSGSALGENVADTFRVEDGAIVASYENYDGFEERFGHMFYEVPYSHYRLRFEYRIFGEPVADVPVWAIRNSGIMFHTPCPETMTVEQDFPISLELQLLRGLGDEEPRPTGNLCTPGTMVVFEGKDDERHCIQSSSPTYDTDDWLTGEILVQGGEKVVHIIEGEPVLEYEHPTYGGPPAVDSDLELLDDGELLTGGYIALQAEGHPVAFRNIELLNLGEPPEDSRFNCRQQ